MAEDILHERLVRLIEPELELAGYDLFELELLRGGGRLTLRLSIERAGDPSSGVTVEDCAAASRATSRILDAEGDDFLRSKYVIEVSSPGLFRRLTKPAHYARFVGSTIKVVVEEEDRKSTRQHRGTLASATEQGIEVEDQDGTSIHLLYERIRKAHLDPDLQFGKDSRKP